MAFPSCASSRPSRDVHPRCGLLDDAERADQRRRHALATDPEILQAALRLGAPVGIGRHVDRANRIRLAPGLRRILGHGRAPSDCRVPLPQCRPACALCHFPQAPGARSARSCAPRAWSRDATRQSARGAVAPSGPLRGPAHLMFHSMTRPGAFVAPARVRRYSRRADAARKDRATARTTERSVPVGDGRGAVEVRERSFHV